LADSNIKVEFTLREAKILCMALSTFSPLKEDEMIAFMLYSRIQSKLEEAKNEKS